MTEPDDTSRAPADGGAKMEAAEPITPKPHTEPKARSRSRGNVLLVVATIVAVGGVTFAVGRLTAPGASGAGDAAGQGRRGSAALGSAADRSPGPEGRNAGGGAGTRMVSGTVKQIDGSTMVVTTGNGTEVAIDVTDAAYHVQSPASATDVTEGSNVAVTVRGSGRDRQNATGASPASPAAEPGEVMASDVTIVATP
jgi:hypothetical protein